MAHTNWTKTVFWYAVVFNILDALSTWFLVCYLQTAIEINPLMAGLINIHPAVFISVKILAATVALAFLYKHSAKHAIARIALHIICYVYAVVMLLHVFNYGIYLALNH